MSAVIFDRVEKTYSGARGSLKALDGVSFQIEPGEFFGLLGPNGAGKTTLISVLAGLARASAGTVTVMGHDVVKDYAAARKALGIVPQELNIDPFFTPAQLLDIQAGMYGVPKAERRERIAGSGTPPRHAAAAACVPRTDSYSAMTLIRFLMLIATSYYQTSKNRQRPPKFVQGNVVGV